MSTYHATLQGFRCSCPLCSSPPLFASLGPTAASSDCRSSLKVRLCQPLSLVCTLASVVSSFQTQSSSSLSSTVDVLASALPAAVCLHLPFPASARCTSRPPTSSVDQVARRTSPRVGQFEFLVSTVSQRLIWSSCSCKTCWNFDLCLTSV